MAEEVAEGLSAATVICLRGRGAASQLQEAMNLLVLLCQCQLDLTNC